MNHILKIVLLSFTAIIGLAMTIVGYVFYQKSHWQYITPFLFIMGLVLSVSSIIYLAVMKRNP